MPWCPKCKAEYREGFTECSTCQVPLVDALPEENEVPEREKFVLPNGMEKPIEVYTAKNRLEATAICDMLHDNDVVAYDRPASFGQIVDYTGADARFGLSIIVDVSQSVRARELIDEMNRNLSETKIDENELARLAEEQAMETPEQPMEDNISFKMLPVVIGVIIVALVLLYFVAN